MSRARWGILGGVFDPIHYAHMAIAEQSREALELGHVLFVPASVPVHRSAAHVSADDRVRMMEIMSYEHYDDADTQFRWFGFGAPIDSELPPYLSDGRLTRYWGPTVELVAAGVGAVAVTVGTTGAVAVGGTATSRSLSR